MSESATTLRGEVAGQPLSLREEQIAEGVWQCESVRQIASRLCISIKTVEAHLAHIYEKCGVRGRVELALWYERRQSSVVAA